MMKQTPGRLDKRSRGLPGLLALCVCLCLGLSGCGGLSLKPWPVNHLLPTTKLKEITIQSAQNSNASTVVLLDIVYDFNDQDAATTIPDKAQDWFMDRSSLQFALKNSIAVSSFEIPPGRVLADTPFPEGYKQAERVMLFTSYQNSGQYFEMDITKLKRIRIDLLEKSIDVVSL